MKMYQRRLLAGFLNQRISEEQRCINFGAFLRADVARLFDSNVQERINKAARRFEDVKSVCAAFFDEATKEEVEELVRECVISEYANAESYGDILRSALREEPMERMQKTNDRIAAFHLHPNEDFKSFQEEVQRPTALPDRTRDFVDFKKAYDESKERRIGIDLIIPELKSTGIKLTDGKVIVVGGWNQSYRTITAQSIALNAVQEGKNALFIFGDLSAEGITKRFLVSHSKHASCSALRPEESVTSRQNA